MAAGVYTVTGQVLDQVYESFLNYAGQAGEYCCMVRGPEMGSPGRELFQKLSSKLIIAEEARTWPGTEHLGKELFEVSWFHLNADFVKVLLDSPNLSRWVEMGLPEDLSFLRPDGTAWFVSILHENDFYFSLTEEERVDISNAVGVNFLEARPSGPFESKCYLPMGMREVK